MSTKKIGRKKLYPHFCALRMTDEQWQFVQSIARVDPSSAHGHPNINAAIRRCIDATMRAVGELEHDDPL